jgi:subfamily B ATP-binding cassette protein MsbA
MKTYWRLLSYARPLRRFVFPFFIFSVLASTFGILNFTLLIPLLNILFDQVGATERLSASYTLPEVSLSIDYGIAMFNFYFYKILQTYGKLGALQFVCGVIIGSVLLSNICRYFAGRLLERFKANMVAKLRQSVFDRTITLHLGFFSNERKGNIISRLLTDIQEIENSVANTFSAAFKEVFTLLIYLFALFKISFSLTLFAFIIIPFSGSFIAYIVKKMRREAREGQSRLSGLISLMDEVFGGMRVVKGFNAEPYIKEKFRHENDAYRQAILSMAYRRELSAPFSEFMGVSVVAVILLYGGSLVLSNSSELTASEFVFYIATFSQVMRPVKEISNAFSNTQRGIASGERVLELLDTPNTIQVSATPKEIAEFRESIEFRGVHFSYQPDVPVLTDISLRIPKGQTIALVGPSGGGKSTLADLIPRFYDPTHGRVLLDGVDLRDLDPVSLRNQMGIVTQESILFNDTIYNNIVFGTKATREEVEEAARIANAHAFIMEQPEGYQTFIGDRGSKLSGGQRQRLSIARAILQNPPILILDEATSALDTESEKLVQEALIRLRSNRTVVVIAHRLTTIQSADLIVVVQAGRIVESGTHQQLVVKEGGLYKKLIEIQSSESSD